MSDGFKFEIGDRVVTTGDGTSYLPAGIVGIVTNRRFVTNIFGFNEYIFVPDENPYPNVSGWVLIEENLDRAE